MPLEIERVSIRGKPNLTNRPDHVWHRIELKPIFKNFLSFRRSISTARVQDNLTARHSLSPALLRTYWEKYWDFGAPSEQPTVPHFNMGLSCFAFSEIFSALDFYHSPFLIILMVCSGQHQARLMRESLLWFIAPSRFLYFFIFLSTSKNIQHMYNFFLKVG